MLVFRVSKAGVAWLNKNITGQQAQTESIFEELKLINV